MATKTARRKAARDIRWLLSLYLYTLMPWYGDERTPEEVETNKRAFLSTARVRLNQLLEMEDDG